MNMCVSKLRVLSPTCVAAIGPVRVSSMTHRIRPETGAARRRSANRPLLCPWPRETGAKNLLHPEVGIAHAAGRLAQRPPAPTVMTVDPGAIAFGPGVAAIPSRQRHFCGDARGKPEHDGVERAVAPV